MMKTNGLCRRLSALLLAAVMLAGLLPMGVFADETQTDCTTPEACAQGHVQDCPLHVQCGKDAACTYDNGHGGNCSTFVRCTVDEKCTLENGHTVPCSVASETGEETTCSHAYGPWNWSADGETYFRTCGTCQETQEQESPAEIGQLMQSVNEQLLEDLSNLRQLVETGVPSVLTQTAADHLIAGMTPAYTDIKIGETGYETLDKAIAAAQSGDTITLAAGTYSISGQTGIANKTLTFTGTKDAVIEIFNGVNASGSSIAFNNVTLKFDNGNYDGFTHSVSESYTNCTIYGTMFLYATNAAFSGCTFEMLDAATEYSVWTYGAKNVSFSGCVFNTHGKAVLVYNSGEKHDTITLTNCQFNSDASVASDKAAVEVGSSEYSTATSYKLIFSGCTADQFAENPKGIPTGSKLWGNKNSMSALYLDVTIDGANAYVPKVNVTVGDTALSDVTPAQAIAQAGSAPIVVDNNIKTIENIVDAAQEIAAPVAIEIPTVAETATITQAVAAVAQSSNVELAIPVTVAEETASVKLDNSAVQTAAAAGGEVTLTVTASEAPEGETAKEYEIDLKAGEKSIHALGGEATVSLPVPEGVTNPIVYYRNESGIKCYLSRDAVSMVDGNAVYTTNHFSKWGVGEASQFTAVAQSGNYYFSSLQDAIDDAAAGVETTIVLLTDTSEVPISVVAGKNVVIDLNERTVNGRFWINGTATIKNGSINNTSTSKSAIETNSTMTTDEKESGTFTPVLVTEDLNITSGRHCIRVDGGKVDIKSGTYNSVALQAANTQHGINISSGADVTIWNGTFTGAGSTASDSAAVACRDDSTKLVIKDGDYSGGTAYDLNAWGGDITVEGGKFGTVLADDGLITGGTFEGAIYGVRSIIGGKFKVNPQNHVVTEYAVRMTQDGYYEIIKALAKIGAQGYATLVEAITAAQDNDIVVLLDNISSEEITLAKSLTLDMNGKTIANPITLTAKDAALTVQDTSAAASSSVKVKGSRDGLTLNGFTYMDGTEEKMVSAQEGVTTLSADGKTYTPAWFYTVTIDPNGGTVDGNAEFVCVKEGEGFTMPTVTKTGHTLAAWVIDGTEYTDAQIPVLAKSSSATAKWDVNKYTITFDTDGGSTIAPITQNYNTVVTAPNAPTKEGYTFDYWKDAAGQKTEVPAAMPAGNVTLTAVWKAKQYTITFNTNGGSEIAPITQDYDTTVTAPGAPTKPGYQFVEWQDADGKKADIPAKMPAKDMTLSAEWEAISYTVEYYTDATTAAGTDTFTYDKEGKLKETAAAPDASKPNLIGWNTAADGSGTNYTPGAAVKNWTTEDGKVFKLYAQWAAKAAPQFTVTKDTFTYNGLPQDISYTTNAPDNVKITYTAKTKAAGSPVDAGTYNVSVTFTESDTTAAVTYANAATMTIEKAPLTVSYKSETIYAGYAPAWVMEMTGFVNGETDAVLDKKPTLPADKPSALGSHTILPSGGDDNNYSFTYVAGTLTIKEKVVYVYSEEKLLQTGEAAWLVPVLAFCGVAVMAAGAWLTLKKKSYGR